MPSFIFAFSASWKQIKFIIRKYLWKYNKMRQNADVLVLQWLIIITCRLLSLMLFNLVQPLFRYETFKLFEDSKTLEVVPYLTKIDAFGR